jgi:hypothetical protein
MIQATPARQNLLMSQNPSMRCRLTARKGPKANAPLPQVVSGARAVLAYYQMDSKAGRASRQDHARTDTCASLENVMHHVTVMTDASQVKSHATLPPALVGQKRIAVMMSTTMAMGKIIAKMRIAHTSASLEHAARTNCATGAVLHVQSFILT